MNYELGLDRMAEYAKNTNWLQQFLVHEASLRENLQSEQLYGPSEESRRTRARIVNQLNTLAMQNIGRSFNDLCLPSGLNREKYQDTEDKKTIKNKKLDSSHQDQINYKLKDINLHTTRPQHSLQAYLCCSSDDKPKVINLYNRLLNERNLIPWLDERNILPGQDRDFEINKAISDSDVVIVCLSMGSINKEGNLQKEIVHALNIADMKPEGAIFIIPLKLDECELPRRLSRWQPVNFFDVGGYNQLMRSLTNRSEK